MTKLTTNNNFKRFYNFAEINGFFLFLATTCNIYRFITFFDTIHSFALRVAMSPTTTSNLCDITGPYALGYPSVIGGRLRTPF
uniref:Uncharacterized protein n=1 Tax=Romanomermis culicivorax TaxID=13658 RepID=A0A915IC17_ROMCU